MACAFLLRVKSNSESDTVTFENLSLYNQALSTFVVVLTIPYQDLPLGLSTILILGVFRLLSRNNLVSFCPL